jgi:hypothetical protein
MQVATSDDGGVDVACSRSLLLLSADGAAHHAGDGDSSDDAWPSRALATDLSDASSVDHVDGISTDADTSIEGSTLMPVSSDGDESDEIYAATNVDDTPSSVVTDGGNSSTTDSISDVVCVKCGRGDQAEVLLLCDGQGCKIATHIHCCTPPLIHVPLEEEEWLCEECVSSVSSKQLVLLPLPTTTTTTTIDSSPPLPPPPAGTAGLRSPLRRLRRASEMAEHVFLSSTDASTTTGQHDLALVDYHSTKGPSWRNNNERKGEASRRSSYMWKQTIRFRPLMNRYVTRGLLINKPQIAPRRRATGSSRLSADVYTPPQEDDYH